MTQNIFSTDKTEKKMLQHYKFPERKYGKRIKHKTPLGTLKYSSVPCTYILSFSFNRELERHTGFIELNYSL